jgi:N-acetylmuramoyl-L-alanine amidase
MKLRSRHFVIVILISVTTAICNAQQVVIIDSGHDPKFKGATASCGKHEYQYNDEMIEVFSRISTNKFIATRESGKPPVGLSGQDYSFVDALRARVNFEHVAPLTPALFISIHHDSTSEKYLSFDKAICGGRGGKLLSAEFKKQHKVGFNVFVYDDQSPRYFSSLKFAEMVGSALKSLGRIASDYHVPSTDDCKSCRPVNLDLGVWHQNILVLRESQIPSILIEVGNLMDAEDERLVSSERFRLAFSLLLNDAISQYFEQYPH